MGLLSQVFRITLIGAFSSVSSLYISCIFLFQSSKYDIGQVSTDRPKRFHSSPLRTAAGPFCGALIRGLFKKYSLVSSRRALHRATSSYDPSTSRRYYSSKVNSKSKKSKCLRGPIGPTGPTGPQGPAGPPGVCPSSCLDVTRTFPVKRNLLEKKTEKAAFQIALSNSAYTTLESVVIWDTIITNKGDMFSLSSGIFTASKPGKKFLDRPIS